VDPISRSLSAILVPIACRPPSSRPARIAIWQGHRLRWDLIQQLIEEPLTRGPAFDGVRPLDAVRQFEDGHYGQSRFRIAQGDRDLLEHLARVFAGSLGRDQNRRIKNDSHAA
jgi:hypothetical protein